MATIIERDVHHDSGSSNSAAGAIVAIIAVLVIVGLAFFALRYYGYGTTQAPQNTGTNPLNVNVQVPGTTGGQATSQ
ncbi:MAG TPA: hypothetical protein VHA78_00855 [Candidatus Peribacteraceae bacterium]|nr:hypothetical protein [Candidatus Peribacteraceae bacterium]